MARIPQDLKALNSAAMDNPFAADPPLVQATPKTKAEACLVSAVQSTAPAGANDMDILRDGNTLSVNALKESNGDFDTAVGPYGSINNDGKVSISYVDQGSPKPDDGATATTTTIEGNASKAGVPAEMWQGATGNKVTPKQISDTQTGAKTVLGKFRACMSGPG